jgi:hypothetical protein
MGRRAGLQWALSLLVTVSGALGLGMISGWTTAANAANIDALHTVDQYVAALRNDPILVQQVVGAGHTAEVHRALQELATQVDYPVYVALVQAPSDITSEDGSSELASALRRRLGGPGLYVVSIAGRTPSIQVTGAVPDPTMLSLATYAAYDRLREVAGAKESPGYTTAVTTQLILETAASPRFKAVTGPRDPGVMLTDDQLRTLAALPWARAWAGPEDDYESHVGKRWMIGTTVGLGLLLVLVQTAFGWPGWKRSPRSIASRPAIDEVRRDATTAVTALAEAVAALPVGVPHPDVAADAVAAREAAEQALRGKYLDVVGALVLARSGLHDAARCQERDGGQPYRPCYFNPLHGVANIATTWRMDDAEVDLPACGACHHAVTHGRTPKVLRMAGTTSKAYFERDDIWSRTGYGAVVEHFGQMVLSDQASRR